MYGSSPASIDTITWPLEPIPTTGTIECQFSGGVDEAVSDVLVQAVEHRVGALNHEHARPKRVVRVAIELLQNLHHHAPTDGVCGFRVVSTETGWWVASRNEVNDEGKRNLEQRYAELQNLNMDELRARQRSVLSAPERSAHGGGGVGLIEIMRRTNRNLALKFIPAASGRWIFELTAHIAADHD